MSKTTKKKATTTKPKAKSTGDADMKNLLGLMQGMMSQQQKAESAPPAPRTHIKEHGINSLSEMRDDINMLSSSLNGRMTQVEVKVATISDSVEEIKDMMKARNAKFDQDMQSCMKHTNDVVEEERAKRLKLLKALQKKLSDDDVVIMERVSKLKEEVTKITAGLSSDINGTFTELTKLKGITETSSQQRQLSQQESSSAIEKLNNKLKILEVKLAASNNGMFVDDIGADNDDFPDDASDEFMNMETQFARTRYRSQSGSSTAGGFARPKVPVERILHELRQQVSKFEGSIESANVIANDAYTASTGKTHKLGAVGASGHYNQSRRKLAGSSKAARRADSDSESDENTKLSLRSQQAELKALVKRVKTLGENTSKACRTLSTGLTDVQQSTLFLYAWCDKAHDAFSVVSSQLGLTTNICPRVQVYRSTATPKAIDDL